jgi:hypothetical protein
VPWRINEARTHPDKNRRDVCASRASSRRSGDVPWPTAQEGVKKSAIPVILSAAKNLQLFVSKKINADASLRSA